MRRAAILATAALLAVATPFAGAAHESGASSLHLRVEGERVEGEWELTTRDARALLGAPLERQPDTLSADERVALGAVFLERVRIFANDRPCKIDIGSGAVPRDGVPPSEQLTLTAHCPVKMQTLRIAYPMLFDLDPRHRGYFSLRDARHTQAGVFHPEQAEITLSVEHGDPWRTLFDYAREGLFHVWGGPDHLLFLLSLLLPTVLGGEKRKGAIALEVVGIVTAFTIAHSLALAASVLGIVRLPARTVEIAIALSVFAVAWNNVRRWLPFRAAWLAFGFGLVHGLGFASALVRYGLPLDARSLALLGFNGGVEAGQLVVVAVWLPIAYAVRDTRIYREWVVPGASLAVAWLALVWTLERSFGWSLLPAFAGS